MTSPSALSRFRTEYGAHRASEGRAHPVEETRALPYLRTGPLAQQWAVRARTFDAFVTHVLLPATTRLGRPPRLLDLGAGNGWLCWRSVRDGAAATAVDIRDDHVDGLGAALAFCDGDALAFDRIVASFDALPLATEDFDIVVFNASIHYATDLGATLREARRVLRDDGRIAILDSPFYARTEDGQAMVAEKQSRASAEFGTRADALMALPFIEYLTVGRLAAATTGLDIGWRRQRVAYPLWYEARPLLARLKGQRRPSRFDLWVGTVS